MKHLMSLLFILFLSSTAFAEISCVVPYGHPDVFRPVQKILIEYQENRHFVRWPVEAECAAMDEKAIGCEFSFDSKKYEALIDLSLAAGSEYQEAGEITTTRFLLWHSYSPIYCKTVE